MAQYLTPSIFALSDGSSNPLSGAFLYIYEIGTTTELSLFSDEALTTPRANPIVADAAGYFDNAFLSETQFKAVLKSSGGVTLYTRENVYSIGSSSGIEASNVSFDGTNLGFSADNVQAAIEEVASTVGSPTTTRGDMIFRGASEDERLAKGTQYQILAQGSDDPAWVTNTDCWSGIIRTVANETILLVVNVPFAGEILSVTTKSVSGTCTATVKISTVSLGGSSNSVSSSETTQAHSSANVFAVGDDIQITTASNSSCVDLSFTIKFTKRLS